jgi:hypothetical protein
VISGDPWGGASERLSAGGHNIPLLVGAGSGNVDLFPLEVFVNAYEDAVGGGEDDDELDDDINSDDDDVDRDSDDDRYSDDGDGSDDGC